MIRHIHACLLSLVFAALSCASAGCSDGGGNPGPAHTGDPGNDHSGDSGNPGSSKGPSTTQDCLDVEKAVTDAATRCGFTPAEVQELDSAFLQKINGSCTNVVDIRDESSLRTQCIPSFQTMTCNTFTSGTWDPSCKGQLLVPDNGVSSSSSTTLERRSPETSMQQSLGSLSGVQ